MVSARGSVYVSHTVGDPGQSAMQGHWTLELVLPLGHFGFCHFCSGKHPSVLAVLEDSWCFTEMETRCGGTCLITAPGWQTEGDLKFEASLIYTEKACLKS